MESTSSAGRAVRTVLVTGASSGIGRETALLLAARGDNLVLLARRVDELRLLASECRGLGSPHALVVPADVTDAAAVDEAFARTVREVGPIDHVIHVAGVAAYGRFEDIPAESFNRVLEVNVLGTANVARSALHHFDEHGLEGRLVLFGSVVGRITAPNFSPYVASKWAVHGLARTLQAEQDNGGHRVSLVAPGGVATSIYEKAASYLGVQGKPPPPVADAAKVAEATVALLDRPRRARSIGALNPLMSLGFRLVPAIYDRVVGPLMSRLALDDKPVADNAGNLFEPVAEPGDRSTTTRSEYV